MKCIVPPLGLLALCVLLSACQSATRIEPYTKKRIDSSGEVSLTRSEGQVIAFLRLPLPHPDHQPRKILGVQPVILIDGKPSPRFALTRGSAGSLGYDAYGDFSEVDLLGGKPSVKVQLVCSYTVGEVNTLTVAKPPLFAGTLKSAAVTVATDIPPEVLKLNPLEKKFQKMLSGATLTGTFTMGKKGGKLHKESYTITRLTKMNKDFWAFHIKMRYGGRDQTFGMPFRIVWAGDTPMITLTRLTIPTVGTYTARVIFYNDKYAGTWSGGSHGGHLFGRINPASKTKKKTSRK